jgi:transcriptional antiterminator NusG
MSDDTKQNHLEDEMDEVTTVPESDSISETELPTESPVSEGDVIPEETPAEITEETEAPKDIPSTKTESTAVIPTVFENVPANAKWFVLHTYSGHENRVAAAIRQRSEAMNIGNHVFDIVVPTRDTVTVKRGKKEEVKEKIFPGYILVRMILNDDSWLVVRTTPGVTAFVGIGNRPTPLSEKEVDSIMKFSQLAAPKFKAAFSKGEAVKIVDGPFADFLGTVDSIDEAKGKVKVLVSIFGRETPVELDFLQVSKL